MSDPIFSIANRIVVLTGGLGLLGRHYASALLQNGAKLAILDRQAEGAPLPANLDSFSDQDLLVLKCDITKRVELESALARIQAHWNACPWGLINNAAIDSPPDAKASENGPFEQYPEASLDRVMEVNVKGTFLTCQVIGGAMASNGGGSIVNISSIYGLVSPNQSLYEFRRCNGEEFFKPAAYSVSKSAIFNLTRYLATYWASKGVRVNTLTLGGVYNNQPKEFLSGYSRLVPLGRMARDGEYNGAIMFLLSDASSYMTGSNLVIDGGWTSW